MTASENIHASVSPETAEKLRRVVAAIKPERLDMDEFIAGPLAPDWLLASCRQLLDPYACGTVGCLAGWAVAILWDGVVEDEDEIIEDAAARLLGIDRLASSRLFYHAYWPVPTFNKISGAPGLAMLRDRVEHFIATGE